LSGQLGQGWCAPRHTDLQAAVSSWRLIPRGPSCRGTSRAGAGWHGTRALGTRAAGAKAACPAYKDSRICLLPLHFAQHGLVRTAHNELAQLCASGGAGWIRLRRAQLSPRFSSHFYHSCDLCSPPFRISLTGSEAKLLFPRLVVTISARPANPFISMRPTTTGNVCTATGARGRSKRGLCTRPTQTCSRQ
jgi:hypothetical protein